MAASIGIKYFDENTKRCKACTSACLNINIKLVKFGIQFCAFVFQGLDIITRSATKDV